MKAYKYKAFISYSHADARIGAWLHRRLENYGLPKHIIGRQTAIGSVPARLRPIFRDREDLAAAGDLGTTIETALSESENLIVVCSPAAAKSHWVNQEVLFFKRQNRGANIFAVITGGEPFSGGDDECLPPALRFALDEGGTLSDIPAEPLAADLREHGDGKRLGVLKLIAGMIGVGLDELVQRDLQKRNRRVTAITVASLASVLVMGALTYTALDARKDAEARTQDAERLIEFMVTDLKEKLDGVGRLDILESVGQQASDYYDRYPLSKHDDDALGRRARVFHNLGQVWSDRGNLDAAREFYQSAYGSTQALLNRNPNDYDRIFNHAQSVYYVGETYWQSETPNKANPYFQSYVDLAERLSAIEPDLPRTRQELAYAYGNIGAFHIRNGNPDTAIEIFKNRIPEFKKRIEIKNAKPVHFRDLGEAYAWIADAYEQKNEIENAYNYRSLQRDVYIKALSIYPESKMLAVEALEAGVSIIRLEGLRGNTLISRKLIKTLLADAQSFHTFDVKNANWAEALLNVLYTQLNQYIHQADRENVKLNLKSIHDVETLYPNVTFIEREAFQKSKQDAYALLETKEKNQREE